ncbi:MAG: alpha/beta hydrolase [Salinibacterium sp.]|nr:alpha/beta hydrolase [Salinibacterium sp.]
MASLLSRLAPLVITLRGSKREFRSAERTLARVRREREHPVSFEPPAKLRRTVHITRADAAGWPVFVVAPLAGSAGRGTTASGGTVTGEAIYLHGGVYSFEIDPVHWAFIAKLAVEARVRVTVPIMPLAPEGIASVIVPIVADIAEELVTRAGAERTSILGDSSGGGMALAVAMVLRDRGVAAFGATVLIAPWLDISGSDPRLAELEPSDPWLAVAGTRAAGALYRAELAETDPMVSPIHGSLNGLGPITMFSGTRDILNADAHRLLALAALTGHPLDYHEGVGMIHNYPILPMPEGDAARAIIVAAIR